MGKLFDEYKEKRKKNKKRIAEEWNEDNPDNLISADDLAPVETGKNKWFNTSLLDDGWDPGDIFKTILGTAGDVAEDFGKGFLSAGEGIADTVAYGVEKAAGFLDNEELEEKARVFQERDLVSDIRNRSTSILDLLNPGVDTDDMNSILRKSGSNIDTLSILGDKGDALVQSGGQLAAQSMMAGAGMMPWQLSVGSSAYSQGVQEARKNGADEKEAATFGLISAGSEIITEKIFGGMGNVGGKGFMDSLTGTMADKISKRAVKTLAKYGIDAVGEGVEEVATEVFTNIGKKLTYEDEKTWKELLASEEAMEGYVDSFVSGALLSGALNSKKAAGSIKSGRDYDTGFSANEEAVVKKEVGKRTEQLQKEAAVTAEVKRQVEELSKTANLSDSEKRNIEKSVREQLDNGELDFSTTKLSKKELAEIEEQVTEDFRKGYIDIDTIESTLAEGRITQIRDLTAKRDNTSNAKEKAEIQKEIDQLTKEKNMQMKSLVAKDYILQESYKQELLKGESFKRDVSDSDTEITKELEESAKAAGMNNTRRMHELFDYTSKIANDTDTKYGFVNSKQLKSMGYDMKDATINGMVRVQEDGTTKVLINVDSSKALNTIIGHETTHLFEGTQEHQDLVEAVKAYAQMKGDYDGRIKSVQELYKGVENANVENEVTADLVGEYIFTDEQFVMNLTKKPNVFQKVYDYVKHAYKMATAGSAEARQLLKAKRAFEKAYKSMKPESVGNSDTKFSISYTKDNKAVAVIEEDILKDVPQEEWLRKVKKQILTFRPGVEVGGRLVKVSRKSADHFNKSDYTDKIRNKEPDVYKDKMNASQGIDDITKASTDYVNESQKHSRDDNIKEFARGDVLLRIGENDYEAKVIVAYTELGEMFFYDVQDLNPTSFELKENRRGPNRLDKSYTDATTTSSKDIISQNNTKSNEISENNEVSMFSLSKTVEETKELVALHNLTPEKLLKTLDLGGMPMPSVAITKPEEIDHSNFGEISLILNKESIDPKKSKYNKVFSGDAYTPTFPQVAYAVNEETAERVTGKVRSLYDTLPDFYQRSVKRLLDSDNIEETLNREGGEQSFIEKNLNDYGVKQLYLADKGEVVPVEMKRTETEISDYDREEFQYYIEKLGEEAIQSSKAPGVSGREWFKQYGEQVKDAFFDLLVKDGISAEEARRVVDAQNGLYWVNRARNAASFIQNGGVTVKEEPDYSGTQAKIDEKIANSDFSQWVNDLFQGIVGYAGIRNNKDQFTPSGTRRSFTSLHDPLTLDNIVKAMRGEEQQKGQGALGLGNLKGASAQEFKSIKDIKSNASRLGTLTEEEQKANQDYISDTLMDLARRYASGKDIIDARNTLVEAVANNESKSGITNYLKQFDFVYKYDESIVDELIELRDYIRSQPTPYFEAKPRRAVGLDEVGVFVIPNNLDASLKSRLLEEGYSIAEYNPEIEGDRQKVVNQFEEYKFSLSRTSDDIAPIAEEYNQTLPAGSYEVYGRDVKQRSTFDDIAPVAESAVSKPKPDEEDIAPVAEPTISETETVEEDIAPVRAARSITPLSDEEVATFEPEAIPNEVVEEETTQAKTRKELRNALIENDKDFIRTALENARPGGRMFRLLLNNTDTIRANEITFGREAGAKINELIFQKEIDNEAKSIAWQNKERAEIRNLGIHAKDFLGRPTKESAAVQKYGEGQYVNEYGDIMKYGDEELEAEFKDGVTQEKIKHAARVIRAKYDTYIDTANDVLTGLGFDPIPKRNDYMRHFQELNDVFSRFGIPFNPKEMQEHTLPTDINGLTEFWSPQKNYFANAQPRLGIRTEYDAITGIDGYISGIANLIYHTEDIQRGRAFESLIREMYGQDQTIEDLQEENLTEEEIADRIEKIQAHHLSKYAAWLHEWTNNIAGKKSKTDRAIEETADREPFAILDGLRRQVGANMIGFNISSSLTNLIAPAQAMAKTNKVAVFKGTADTVRNLFHKDDFVEKNSFLTSRFGTDMLSKTPFQKLQDAGYVFMQGVDYFSSNLIVRSKFAELRAKGMNEEKAHAEAGKFAARLMGDRTKGANAQLYNSKLFNVIGQFQLEVNNQLYSMFYDTYYDSKENAEGSSAKMAAGVTFTLGQLFVYNHLFGKAFESIAGYNPTLDVLGIMMTALGLGDDDDEEKSTEERLQNAADQLVDALPYVNILTGGGRIPIASAIPNVVGVMTGGKDDYGNELTWEDELKKLLYLVPPAGGNQIKKTYQGLKMFDEDLPIAGSYTNNGNLRFPVEKTVPNMIQAGLFGQWANENAGEYFDGEEAPLKEKQIQEFKELDIPISEYWTIREDMAKMETNDQKISYVGELDLPIAKKNILANNLLDREEPVDMADYDGYSTLDEFDFAVKSPGKYAAANAIGGYDLYTGYMEKFKTFTGEKDENGKTVSGSVKKQVVNYLAESDLEHGVQALLLKCNGYKIDDDMSYALIDYLKQNNNVSYEDKVSILTELGYTVDENGNVGW